MAGTARRCARPAETNLVGAAQGASRRACAFEAETRPRGSRNATRSVRSPRSSEARTWPPPPGRACSSLASARVEVEEPNRAVALVAECVDNTRRHTDERARTELMGLIAEPDGEDAFKDIEQVDEPLVPVQRWARKARGDRRLRQKRCSSGFLGGRLDDDLGVANRISLSLARQVHGGAHRSGVLHTCGRRPANSSGLARSHRASTQSTIEPRLEITPGADPAACSPDLREQWTGRNTGMERDQACGWRP